MTKKILLTGFEPFNNSAINPSQMLAEYLSQQFQYPFLILPVSYKRAVEALTYQLMQQSYDFILMLGLAGDRDKICLERVALNWMDARIADADGILKQGEKADRNGEAAFFSELPLTKWIENSEMTVSNSAGTYVCNYLYYNILQGSYRHKALFVHVPWIRNSADELAAKEQLSLLVSRISEGL